MEESLVNILPEEMPPRTNTPWNKTTWGKLLIATFIIALICLFGFIISFSIAVAGLDKANNINVNPGVFTIESNFTTSSTSLAYATCTNFTIMDDPTSFTSSAEIGYMCPVLQDACNANTCYETDGKCHEVLSTNSTCSSTFPCPEGSTCDLETCSCVSNTMRQCVVDDDCMRILDNPTCQEVTCVSGQCVRDTAFGFACSTNADCAANQFCNGLCICVTPGGSGAEAITYTPTVATTLSYDAVDWDNFFLSTSLTEFIYIQHSNFVRINFRISANENVTASDPYRSAFTFSLPPGFPANVLGFRSGTAVLSPNQAMPLFFAEEVVIESTTTISTYDSGDVVVAFLNGNPAFTGSLLGSVVTVSGFFEYEYLIV